MKVTGSKESLHLFIEQGPIVRPENKGIEQAVRKYFNFKAEKFDAGFQPGIEKADTYPDPDDYQLFPFRLISATILGSGSWKSSDFSNVKVLKASVPLLATKPAYVNHDMFVGNEIGTIGETQWSNGYTASDGTKVPPGIDGPYVIDSKLFPELCRKLNAPIPMIQSSSVTVIYDWESSHEFEHEYDFYYHVGEMLEGREVTRVVTKIHDYIESSLVYLGADPYAKKKDIDGNLINIDKYSIMSNSKDDNDPMYKLYKDKREMYIVEKFSKEKSIPLRHQIIDNFKNDVDPMFTEVQKYIAESLGIKPEEVTKEAIKAYSFVKAEELAALKANETKVTALEAEKTQLETDKKNLETDKTALLEEVTTLKANKATLEANANFGKGILEAKRAECVEAYTKMTNGKPNQVMIDEINACVDAKALDAKLEMFGKKLIDDFGAHCDECGSKKVSYRSSQPEGDDPKEDEKPVKGMLSEFRP